MNREKIINFPSFGRKKYLFAFLKKLGQQNPSMELIRDRMR
jgi:hypothetical protein